MPAPSPAIAAELERLRRAADPASMRPRPPSIWSRVLAALRGTGGRWVGAAELARLLPGTDVRQVAAALGGLALLGKVERRDGRRSPAFRLPPAP